MALLARAMCHCYPTAAAMGMNFVEPSSDFKPERFFSLTQTDVVGVHRNLSISKKLRRGFLDRRRMAWQLRGAQL